jgi:DNA-binding CsgD family transcriptional regulator
MLFEEPRVQELLRRVVFQVSREPGRVEDLMQEANIHLWMLEEHRPEQTLSWYVQSCRFHLLNLLACGRSVDSHKRRPWVVSISENGRVSPLVQKWESESASFPESTEREIVLLLEPWLTRTEKRILDGLSNGLGAREMARQLGISHQAVSKHRHKITLVALRLGLCPMHERPCSL